MLHISTIVADCHLTLVALHLRAEPESSLLARDLLIDLAHLHGDDSLQQARAVLGSGAALQAHHGLRSVHLPAGS